MYLLDTNIVSDVVRNPRGIIRSRIGQVGEDMVFTSIIVAAELRFGLERKRSQRLTAQIEAVLGTLVVLPMGAGSDAHYGHVRADLERRGLPIGANDLFIAAHALSLGATLVTDNVREFERIEGLVVENWLRSV